MSNYKVTKSAGATASSLSKADQLVKTDFEARVDRSIQAVVKADDEFLIWGPASVEIVDKEDDRVSAKALESALPQLLRRARLSYVHTDQIVGKILEKFETEEPVEVVIDGKTYERQEFPTDVLDLDQEDAEALYVAGSIYNDNEQSREVRRKIESGEIDSYSISGKALTTQKRVESGMVFDDIIEMDLSAVTVCEEGMNQNAKFSRVDGETVDVKAISEPDLESDEIDKNLRTVSGSVADPQEVKTIAKTMTEDNETEGTAKSPEQIDGEIATKSFVEDEVLSKAEQRAANEVEKRLPDGDLATVSFMKEQIENEATDLRESIGKSLEETVEEVVKEEMEVAQDDVDVEEHEAPTEGEVEEESYSEADLKDALPADVWSVVSEYIGSTKADEPDMEDEEEDEDMDMADKSAAQANSDTADEIEKQVRAILQGEGVDSPGIGVNEREEEFEKQFDDESEGGVEVDESPALSNFEY